jgi:hypothetical protein
MTMSLRPWAARAASTYSAPKTINRSGGQSRRVLGSGHVRSESK